MKDFKRPALFLVFCAVLLSSLSLIVVRAQSTATLSTDQKFYSVGQGMVISGKGFSPNAPITLTVTRPDHLTDTVPGVGSDASGSFTANYAPPQEPGRYDITATDGVNTATVAKTEADAIGYNKGVYDKADVTDQGGAGHWTTGNAGNNYLEGQWAFYQYEVTGVGTTIPDFDVSYNHFQTNTNAIFLDSSANWRACMDCNDQTLTTGVDAGMLLDGVFGPPVETTGVAGTHWINAAPAVNPLNHPFTSSNVCDPTNIDPVNGPTQLHCFHVTGATLKQKLNDQENINHSTTGVDYFAHNTHTVTLYWAAHLAATRTWSAGKEYLLGCPSDTNYVTSSSQIATLGFIDLAPPNNIFVAGQEVYNPTAGPCGGPDALSWTGIFNGIGAATGSSRHFELLNQTLGSNGAIDLPIPSVPAPTGSITIVKVTSPAVAAGAVFGFTDDFSGGTGNFNLDTDPSATNPSTITFSGLGGGATYHVSESSMPGGWTNTAIACVNNTGSSVETVNVVPTGGSVDITLDTVKNTAVTCTFTNVGAGHIIVKKHTTPGGAFSASFPFTTTGTGYTNFPLTDGGTNVDGGTPPSGGLTPGTYTISEGSPIASQGGTFWILNSRSCVSANGTSTVPAPATLPVSQPASITLAAGDTVTCDYFNVWPDGNVTITPLTPMNEVNSAETFTVTVNAVTDGATPLVFTSITPTVTPTPNVQNTNTCATPTINGSTATCTITINSSTAGTFNVHVEAVFSIGGVSLTRDTGATTGTTAAGPAAPGPNSPDAVKTYIAPSTTLTTKSAPTSLETGATATVVVTETNTGSGPLTNVNVTGTGACTSFTPATVATLAAGASQDFTCTFTVATGANAWTADGHGTDQLNNPAPSAGEHTSGSVTGVSASTTLVTKTAPTSLEAGATATVVVTETNTGSGPLTNVNVVGGGACASFTPASVATLAAGASADFTCTFTVAAGANAWTADGKGTDELGNPAPTTGEHTSGSVNGVSPSTTLVTKTAPTSLETGATATVVVTETNTGNGPLTGVNVTGGGSCTSFTPASVATLAAGASADFTCTFTVAAGANAWSADGHGTDSLGNAAPSTGEHTSGSVNGVSPSTTLVTKTAPSSLEAGATATIVVTETNTGNGPLTGVNVTGGGSCASFSPASVATLAAGASADFTCSFTVAGGANGWFADGHGTDSLGNAAPTTGEHTSGSVSGVVAATTLTLKSATPAPVIAGSLVTIVVTETNTGNGPLTSVNVSGGGACASFTGGASTLAAGASTDFTCTFTAAAGLNAWFADGHGLDSLGNAAPATNEHQAGSVTGLVLPTLTILKSTHGATDTFGWTVTGSNPLTPSASVPANSTNFSVFTSTINIGTNVISENAPPAGWTLTDVSCTGYTGAAGDGPGTVDANGVPTNWTFTATYGDHVVCSYVNSNVQTTRTQGFWATHTALASNVWNGTAGLSGETSLGTDNTLCGVTITAQLGTAEENELMGGFWASISQTSTHSKRTPIDQARMQMLQQYLAAVLNVHAFGSGSEGMLTAAQNAYCGDDASAIKAQVGILGTFNQSGDNGTFTPGASATAPESKKEADIDFWDTPKTPSEPQP